MLEAVQRRSWTEIVTYKEVFKLRKRSYKVVRKQFQGNLKGAALTKAM